MVLLVGFLSFGPSQEVETLPWVKFPAMKKYAIEINLSQLEEISMKNPSSTICGEKTRI